MFKKIVVGVLVVLMGFFGVIILQPSAVHIERTLAMAAPASDVFAQVNDFHKWNAWSPWDKMDPKMTRTFSGADAGEGAKYAWVGDPNNVGEGSMTILESKPNEKIHIKLDFVKPMAATNDVHFTFEPEGDGTKVTWTMDGKNNFFCKAMCLFMDMDKMVGGEFEKGLADIKKVVAADAKK